MAHEHEIETDGTAEAVDRIRDAEDRAREILRDAREARVPTLIRGARQAAGAEREEILSRAREDAARLKTAALDAARREAADIARTTEADLAALRATAENRKPQAVDAARRKLAELIR